ncbi:MAG TPA: flagellar hook-basal body complex protein [bacterium]|nr:flagellar hook-basal body complex protein [bacterium]
MSIRSIFTGLTGLNTIDKNIDVIGNNIANVNTVGFRAGRATFDDLFVSTLFAGVGSQGARGGINPRQIGSGVSLGSVDTIFSQGNLQTTGRLLDLAIQGEGFFVLRDNDLQQVLTRAGNFSLDTDGYLVDPGNGFRLQGRQANAVGQIDNTKPVADLRLDFGSTIEAQKTTSVSAGGNLYANSEPIPATVSSSLQGLFNRYGESVGLLNGDVIRFETGFVDLANAPDNVVEPINLSTFDFGKGAGVILSVGADTTLEDLAKAIDNALDSVVEQSIPGSESAFQVSVDTETGQFIFQNGSDALNGVRVGLSPRGTDSVPPPQANRVLGEIFTTVDDPNYTRTLDVAANSIVRTEGLTQANRTSSIEVFDSQGNSRTLTLGFARDSRPPEAIGSTQIGKLLDRDQRKIIYGGFPQNPTYVDPVIDPTNNTAVFTAYQIDNIVATQGVYSFNDSAGNMISLRLSDGAISFNGQEFLLPTATTRADGTTALTAADQAILQALNVQGAQQLNIGGGFMDQGFTEETTLENIRERIESRINNAIATLVTGIGSADVQTNLATTTIPGLAGSTNLLDINSDYIVPDLQIDLTDEGSFEFSFKDNTAGAALGQASNSNYQSTLATSAGGEANLGLMMDLAAKTRSVRVSTLTETPAGSGTFVADNQVDDDVTDATVTKFTESPFAANLANAFTVGATDNGNLANVNPADAPNTGLAPEQSNPATVAAALGIRDSGVQLVALSTGMFPGSNIVDSAGDPIVTGLFDGTKAFDGKANAFNSLFNPRGYGIADSFNGDSTIDRPDHLPLSGISISTTDTSPVETNTFHTTSDMRRNSYAWQAVVPNSSNTIPTGTVGYVDFDSSGKFFSYGNGSLDTPTINFDPDGIDPVNGGVDPLNFQLDLTSMTHYGNASDTATLLNQDGRGVGSLESVSISPDGLIIGAFSNGATRYLGGIVLAQVTNEGGLIQLGDTLFAEGANSGQITVYDPGMGGTGEIQSGNLELSNVDIATEFTNLIVSQRAFSANSRIITTNDQILQEVVNLVR